MISDLDIIMQVYLVYGTCFNFVQPRFIQFFFPYCLYRKEDPPLFKKKINMMQLVVITFGCW